MDQKRKIRTRVWITVIVVFYIMSCRTIKADASEAQSETVRVGFFHLNGFQEYDSDGRETGYHVEYLDKIAVYTRWNYEFVPANSWVNALQMLEEGKIDLLAPAQITEERKQKFLFSSNSFGIEYGSLLTWKGNDALAYEDFTSFQNIKIGCVDTFIMKDEFLKYAEKNGFQPDIIYYQDTNELLAALERHEVQAIAANLDVADETKKVLAKYSPSPYYFMLNREKENLVAELDNAVVKIKIEEPNLENELTKKCFPIFQDTPFTLEELDYIENAPVFRVGYADLRAPVSYQDSQGNAQGITIEIMEEISKISGLKFEYIPLAGTSITYDDLREKKLSLITGVEYSAVNAHQSGIRMSQPFFSTRKILVGRKGIRFSPDAAFRIAICSGSQTLPQSLLEKYPRFEIETFLTTEECLDAVLEGRADIMLQSQYAVEKLLSKPAYQKLIVIPETGLEEDLSISPVLFSQEKDKTDPVLSDERLVSVLNKAIAKLDESVVSSIVISNTAGIPYELTLEDFYDQYRVPILIILFFSAVIGSVILYAVKMRRIDVAKVRSSEKQLRCITNNINGGVVVLIPGKGFAIQYANIGFIKMIGADEEYFKIIQAGSYITYVHKEDIPKLNQLTEQKLEDGTEIELEIRIKKMNGEYIPAIFNGTAAIDNENVILYCVVVDISEQKKMMDKLEIEKERYSMIIEQTDDIIFDVNTEERQVVFSNKYEQIFGWKETKIVMESSPDALHIHRDDLETYIHMQREIMANKEVITSRFRLQKRRGEYIWCDITMRTVRRKNKLVRIVGKITDVDKMVKEHERLQLISKQDSLTGLLNKEAFKLQVEDYLGRNVKKDCALLFLDIDNFKALNDTLGHMAGDHALKEVAEVIRHHFREEDTVGRFGGDEFFIFSKDIPLEVFFRKLEKIRSSLFRTYYGEEKTQKVSISASMGFTYSPDGNISYEELLEQADKALYSAKEQGKNRYVMYHDELVLNGYENSR